jgi:hypothetical protein
VIADALFALLTSEAAAAIVAKLATFGGAPAIFTGGLPDDCPLPAIVITDAGGSPGGDGETRDKAGCVCNANIQVFGDKSYSTKALRDIARLVWTLVHRNDLAAQLAAVNWVNAGGVYANPPASTRDDLGFPGYMIQVKATLRAA